MTVLGLFTQWLLSTSLLVGAYFLGRRSQHDIRLLPAAIILFLFAVPVPIIASLFPGPDQLREFTYIKYGPPVAAFLEAQQRGYLSDTSKDLRSNRRPDNTSKNQNVSQSQTEKVGQLTSESKSLETKAGYQAGLGFLDVPNFTNRSADSRGTEKESESRAVERNASGALSGLQDDPNRGFGEPVFNVTVETRSQVDGNRSSSLSSGRSHNSSAFQLTNITKQTGNESNARPLSIPTILSNQTNTTSNVTNFCLDHLALGSWRNASSGKPNQKQKSSTALVDTSAKESLSESLNSGSGMSWDWEALGVQRCNFTTKGRLESLGLLAQLAHSKPPASETMGTVKDSRVAVSGKDSTLEPLDGPVTRVVVAGDSQGRLFALALLRLVREIAEDELGTFQQKHRDWNATAADGQLRVEFWWAPFASNFTERLHSGGPEAEAPDVLIMSFGLWHMLYTNDPGNYGRGVRELDAALQETYRIRADVAPLLFWLSTPALVTERLNTKAKRARLTGPMLTAYNQEAERSGFLRPNGAAVLLDLMTVTASCGASCAPDGMHYIPEAYRVVVQAMLNAIALTL